MQTDRSDRPIILQALPPGQLFRFCHAGEIAVALKARFDYGQGDDAVLVLRELTGDRVK